MIARENGELMRILTAVIAALALMNSTSAFAEETMKEKAKATGKSVKATATKAGNRVSEAVCMEGDAKCAAKKAGNRVEEGAGKVGDKASEIKENVD